MIELARVLGDFATGMQGADVAGRRRSVLEADRATSRVSALITEAQTIKLVVNELAKMDSAYARY
jgi:hypothetical protein